MFDVNAIRSRLGSLSPDSLDQIKDVSVAAWRLLAIDLSGILDDLSKNNKDDYVEVVSANQGNKIIRRVRGGHGESRVLGS